MKNVYRVNYYIGGVPAQAFVCAETDVEASAFVGVRDGSAQTNMIAKDVEVAGVDKPHDALIGIAPSVAPFEAPKSVSRQEFAQLQEQLAALQNQLAGHGAGIPVVNNG